MERGFKPDEILALSGGEKNVWQAIAELNMEKRKQDMRDAMLEALTIILNSISKRK